MSCLCFLMCCLGLSQLFFQGASDFYPSWLHSVSAVIWEPKKKVCPCFHCLPIYMPWSDGAMTLVFWMLSFKPILGSTLRKTFYLGFNLLQKVNKRKLLQCLFLGLSDFCLPVNIFQQPAFIILIIILDYILLYIYIFYFLKSFKLTLSGCFIFHI